MSLFQRAQIKLSRKVSLVDIFIFVFLVLGVYALMGVAAQWGGPFRPKTEIRLDFVSLAQYGLLSLVRVVVAYLFSFVFTITYGYLAAKSKTAEPILVSVLDILQCVPVLGFMPGLVITLVYLFPRSNFGLELAAVLMIFTGQAWNMVFSFYCSLKTIPDEWKDLARLFKLNKIQMFSRVELPYAANGLLWNSMLSVAGGWFFLMVIESFTLGDRDFRLPGIGSYMAVAYERSDWAAILAGVLAMFVLIVIVDRVLWGPLVVWSERFKVDTKEDELPQRSVVFDWMKRSNLLPYLFDLAEVARKRLQKRRDELIRRRGKAAARVAAKRRRLGYRLLWSLLIGLLTCVMIYGVRSMFVFVRATSTTTWLLLIGETALTLVRVSISVVVGSLWTIPVGVFIGTNPVWTRRLQPVVQIVAAFPAPMLFPMVAFGLVKLGINIEVGSVVLLFLACQWYILFNVISGASVMPSQMIEVAEVFRVKGWPYWRDIILPAIFPSLVNGWITAAGGAWNACIVAEWVQSGNKVLAARGIGSAISRAAQAADYPTLACAVLTLVVTVVLLNRFFWGGLYRMAETRFKLEI